MGSSHIYRLSILNAFKHLKMLVTVSFSVGDLELLRCSIAGNIIHQMSTHALYMSRVVTCMQANFSSLLTLTSRSKTKQLYLTSITRNSKSADKREVDGALILLPLLHQCSALRVFKATFNWCQSISKTRY